MLVNGINFDNTKAIQDFAKTEKAQKILNISKGNEKQLYSIGQKVNGNGYGFNMGVITDVWCENGYYRYEIEYKLTPKARKTYTKNLRQIDIIIVD